MTAPDTTGRKAPRSWPLLVLAGLSFFPGFGFFFAAAAVTWGLVSDRPRAKLAVIIGGAGAALHVAAVVLLMITLDDSADLANARVQGTQHDLVRLVEELERYRERTGRYPTTLHDLVGRRFPPRFINIYDQSAGMFTAARPYQYRLAPGGESYDLFAAGPDGQPRTDDDVRPQLPDAALRHSGYRPPE